MQQPFKKMPDHPLPYPPKDAPNKELQAWVDAMPQPRPKPEWLIHWDYGGKAESAFRSMRDAFIAHRARCRELAAQWEGQGHAELARQLLASLDEGFDELPDEFTYKMLKTQGLLAQALLEDEP